MNKLYRIKKILRVALVAVVLSVGVLQFSPVVSAQTATNSCGTANSTDCLYDKYINPLVKLLAVVAGLAVVGGITYGGILYASSAGDAGKVTKAKETISKALFALVAFMLLGAFLQFVSPTSLTGGSGTCSRSFAGLKTWYAYIPDKYIDKTKCTFNGDLPLLPSGSDQGVVPLVVLAVVDDLLRIAAMVAVVFVITGGVRYATSQGEPGEVKNALSTIINALIGLATAIVAAAVVSYIGNKLAGL